PFQSAEIDRAASLGPGERVVAAFGCRAEAGDQAVAVHRSREHAIAIERGNTHHTPRRRPHEADTGAGLRLTKAGNDVVLAQRIGGDVRSLHRTDVPETSVDRPEEGPERVVVPRISTDHGALAIHQLHKHVLTEPADLDPAGRSDRKEERAGGSRGLDN